MTKKEFTRETKDILMNLNNKDLEIVRKGIYTLCKELRIRKCLEREKLNDISKFLRDIDLETALITIERKKL